MLVAKLKNNDVKEGQPTCISTLLYHISVGKIKTEVHLRILFNK